MKTRIPKQTSEMCACVEYSLIRFIRVKWIEGASLVFSILGPSPRILGLGLPLAVFVVLCLQPMTAGGAVAEAWVRHYGGTTNGNSVASVVAVGGNGNVYVTGDDPLFNHATVAYSTDGLPLWTNACAVGGYAIAVDGSGNVFVTGDSGTVAYSAAGAPLWTNLFGGYAVAVAVDSSANVFVTGSSHATNYATLAYSGAGLPLWTNISNFGGNALAVDTGGNVFVTGNGTIAYSAAGASLWTNCCSYGSDIAADKSGHVFVVTGGSDIFAFSSASGAMLWAKSHANWWGSAIAVDGVGNVFVTGTRYVWNDDYDFLTFGYSGTGLSLWTNRYSVAGREGRTDDGASGVVVDANGNVFVVGYNDSGNTVVAYSPAGAALWAKPNNFELHVNGPPGSRNMAVTGDGSVVVVGQSQGAYITVKYVTVPDLTVLEVRALKVGLPSPGMNTLECVGVPNNPYILQFTTNLSGGPWLNLSTNLAQATDGLWTVIDPEASNAQKFYRITTP